LAVDFFEGEVLSARDFYPFGMVMPERSFSTGSYRYGFNGKEFDSEWKGEGNSYDYGFRVHDARLGRFLSVDPLAAEYPWYTPYQFAGNKVVLAIDLDGLEEYEMHYHSDFSKARITLVSKDKPFSVTHIYPNGQRELLPDFRNSKMRNENQLVQDWYDYRTYNDPETNDWYINPINIEITQAKEGEKQVFDDDMWIRTRSLNVKVQGRKVREVEWHKMDYSEPYQYLSGHGNNAALYKQKMAALKSNTDALLTLVRSKAMKGSSLKIKITASAISPPNSNPQTVLYTSTIGKNFGKLSGKTTNYTYNDVLQSRVDETKTSWINTLPKEIVDRIGWTQELDYKTQKDEVKIEVKYKTTVIR
jgi:RHS repeat-associated protein